MSHLSITSIRGSAIEPYLTQLGSLRITVFREYPYLYDGTMDYEKEYLAPLVRSPDSLAVVVKDDTSVVGFSSATPLSATHQELQNPFSGHDIDPTRVLYLAEFVLLPSFRGKGLGRMLMEKNIAHAEEANRFDTIALCAVDRTNYAVPPPPAYRSPDNLWRAAGFTRAGENGTPSITASFAWRVVGDSHETAHPMVFWLRAVSSR